MRNHLRIVAGLAAGMALLVSACGGGGGGESAAQEPASAGAETAKTIRIAATDFAFEPRTLELSAPGEYTLVVTNDGKAEHALEIEGPGVAEKTATIGPGGEAEVSVEIAEPGTYKIYCPVSGHRDMGMEGELTAKAS